jgi:hypothetical protein
VDPHFGIAGRRYVIAGRSSLVRSLSAVFASAVLAVWPAAAGAQQQPGASIPNVLLGERRVSVLPEEPLVWRLETFSEQAAAEAAATETAFVFEYRNQLWLASLSPAGLASPGGTLVAEVGPLPIPAAEEYLIRIQGQRDRSPNAHTHPGSESFYVLSGEVGVETPDGLIQAMAGEGLLGPSGGTSVKTLKLTEDMDTFAMFVVDATLPFSAPVVPAAAPPGG